MRTETEGGTTFWLGASACDGDQMDPGPTPAPTDDSVFAFRRLGGDLRVDSKWLFLAAEAIAGRKVRGGMSDDQQGAYLTLVGKSRWNVGPIFRYDVFDPNTAAAGDIRRVLTGGAYLDVEAIRARLVANAEIDLSAANQDNVLLVMAQVVF